MSSSSLARLEMNFNKSSFAFTRETQAGTLLALLTTVHKSSSFLQRIKRYHVDEFNYRASRPSHHQEEIRLGGSAENPEWFFFIHMRQKALYIVGCGRQKLYKY